MQTQTDKKGLTMYQFTIPKMSCGGCLNNITKAINKLDANAKVEADFPSKTLKVETDLTEMEAIEAITGAGYPPTP
jgi:copper chaperone